MGLQYRIECDDTFCTEHTLCWNTEQKCIEVARLSGFVKQPDGTWLCARCNKEKQEEVSDGTAKA